MPKGMPLPNMMDSEIVQMFYSVIKNSSETDFGAVAKELDLKDAGAAKARLQRMMKAQEKKVPAPKAADGKAKAATGPAKAAVGEGKNPAGRVKKRKLEKEEESKKELKKEPNEELESEENGVNGDDDDDEEEV